MTSTHLDSPNRQTSFEPDVQVSDRGSIVLIAPLTAQAQAWLEEHIAIGAMYFAGALAVERRYVFPIVSAMCEAGLILDRRVSR